jgi:hypothetical protein
MKTTVIIVLLFFSVNAMGQLSHFATIEKSNDTLADLRYFKNLDNKIKEKLDSFLVFIKSKKMTDKENKGFIEFCLIRNSAGRIMADLSLNTQYAAYRIYAFKRNNFGNVFAFSFYKSNLILFTLPTNKHKIKEEFGSLLNELMYAELSKEVQKEIDAKTEEFQIDGIGIVKRYYLK